MAKPIDIPLVMNARGVAAGAKDAEDSLDRVADSLDELARDGDQSLEKVERSFRDLADSAQRESRKIGDDLDRHIVGGANRGQDAVREFRSEAIQNLGEVASSFDGSIEGVADGFQGLAGGAAASLLSIGGPIAGVGGALAGIGIIGGTVFNNMAEDAEAAEERISNAFEDMIESGNNFVSEQFLASEVQRILDDPGLYESAQKIAEQINVPMDTAVRALAGYGDSAATVRERVQFELDELQSAISRGGRGAEQQLGGQVGVLEAINRKLSDTANGYNAAATKAQVYRDATANAREETQNLGDALGSLPTETNVSVLVEADTSALDRELARSRTVRVNLEGYARSGQRVI